jgi:hypothetical protein
MRGGLLLALAIGALVGCAKEEGGALGVPDCDRYLEAARACVRKLGPTTVTGNQLSGKTQMQQKIWRSSDRASLPSLCERALAEAKAAQPACEW